MLKKLISSCINEDINEVKSILNRCDENILEKQEIHTNFNIIFRNACFHTTANIVEYLLEYSEIHKININMYSDEVLFHAIGYFCSYGNINIIKRLIKYCENHNIDTNLHYIDDRAFRTSCLDGHPDCARYILDYYYKKNDYISVDIWKRHIKYLIDNACRLNYLSVIKLLIAYSKHQSNCYKIIPKIDADDTIIFNSKKRKIIQCLYITKKVIQFTKTFMFNNNLIHIKGYYYVHKIEYYINYMLIL